ncbi:AGE family epimerase/isomerase [Flagellimonas olearia]|nr:AGE family epimerase/isomerase [Allomuricauda olearia]
MTSAMTPQTKKQLLDLYRELLLEDVIPWWTRHAIDRSGAINTCIQDDGTIISKERWLWSQWRAVWVFSKLYNSIEKREEWLQIALGIYSFLVKYNPLDDGHWPTLLDEKGNVLRGYESIYVDGFAIYGLSELYRATGDPYVQELAMRTFWATEKDLKKDDPPPSWPYPIETGRMSHGISMIFSIAYHELAEVTGDKIVRDAAIHHHRKVMDGFYRKDRNSVLEFLDREGKELDHPKGKVSVPGHAIESMWFQIHIAKANNDAETIEKAVDIIKESLEMGWDEQYGGLFLAMDIEGNEEVDWPHYNTKLWWPHTEALYATLLAYEHSKQPWCMEWHEKIKQWSFEHFPTDHGEWKQKLTRTGIEITDTLVLPVKDPFHLPRALIYTILLLQEDLTNIR